jgi:hypothetical protein
MKQYVSAGTYQHVLNVTQGVIYLRLPGLPVGSYIERADVWIGAPFASTGFSVVCDINQNGASLFSSLSDRPSILTGQMTAHVSGLTVEVSRGDIITLDVDDLPPERITAPIYLGLTIEDGQTAGLTEAEVIAAVAGSLVEGSGVMVEYDPDEDTITLSSTGGGVGGGTGGYYLAQAGPASPHAQNDEFHEDSGLWTLFQSSDSTQTIADSCLKIVQTSQSGYKLSGRFQAVPSGDWAIATRLALISNRASYVEGGLALFADATGNPNTTDIVTFSLYDSAGSHTSAGEVWDDHNTYSSDLSSYDASTLESTGFIWLKIVKSGTNYKFYTSSAEALVWYLRRSGTIPFAPAEFGLFIYNNGSTASATVLCDCFRVFAADPMLIGGTA